MMLTLFLEKYFLYFFYLISFFFFAVQLVNAVLSGLLIFTCKVSEQKFLVPIYLYMKMRNTSSTYLQLKPLRKSYSGVNNTYNPLYLKTHT